MPKKLNSAGQMQNYVPAGNGDASGEYGDNATGSNKHFKNFKKPIDDDIKLTDDDVLSANNDWLDDDEWLDEDDIELTDGDVSSKEEPNEEDLTKEEEPDSSGIDDSSWSFIQEMEQDITMELNDLDEDQIQKIYNDFFNLKKLKQLDEEEKFQLLVKKGLYSNISAFDSEEDRKTIMGMMKDVESFMNVDYAYSLKRRTEALWCKSMYQSRREFGDEALKYWNTLTKEEQNVLKIYTGIGYGSMNDFLRGLDDDVTENTKWQVPILTKVLDRSVSKKDVWLQRGTENLFIDADGTDVSKLTKSQLKQLVGKVFTDEGFCSCGAAKKTGFTDKPIIMNIFCPKGTSMMFLGNTAGLPTENEMLLNRGYAFKINKVEKQGEKIYIDVEVLEGSNKNRLKV